MPVLSCNTCNDSNISMLRGMLVNVFACYVLEWPTNLVKPLSTGGRRYRCALSQSVSCNTSNISMLPPPYKTIYQDIRHDTNTTITFIAWALWCVGSCDVRLGDL
jgi:hypothetical protein